MKKQVEGHTSKQAPANRTVYYMDLYFHRCNDKVNGYISATLDNIEKVNKWISCGNQVMLIARYEGYAMQRHTRGITPTMWEKVVFDLDRNNPIDEKVINYILNHNHEQGLSVSF